MAASFAAPDHVLKELQTASVGDVVAGSQIGVLNHSDNSPVVYVPDVKVAFAVDFVSNDRVAFQELPNWRFPDVFDSVPRLLDLDFEVESVLARAPSWALRWPEHATTPCFTGT